MKRLLALLAVQGCVAPALHRTAPLGPPAARVEVEGIHYWTDTLTIQTGQVVEWVNRDIVDHTITFEERGARRLSGKLKAKGEYTVRFDRPGVYAYYCDPHRSMRAVVVVK